METFWRREGVWCVVGELNVKEGKGKGKKKSLFLLLLLACTSESRLTHHHRHRHQQQVSQGSKMSAATCGMNSAAHLVRLRQMRMLTRVLISRREAEQTKQRSIINKS